jgi:tetratricopeptide (TPR) repeat protein
MTLTAHLTALETSGLLRLAQREPELEYLFRHALIQEAAYTSLLKTDRRALHRAVGEVLEQAYADRLDEWSPWLGQHFLTGGEEDRALHYFARAGEVALRGYANAEAVQHYGQALELARRQSTVSLARRQSLYLGLGRAYELLGHYERAIAAYTEMSDLAQTRGDRPLELAALIELTKLRAIPSGAYDPPQGRVLAEKALALARALGDQAAEARLLWIMALLNIYSGGGLPEAAAYGDQALSLTRALDLPELRAFILNDVWYAYVGIGDLKRAWAMLTEAQQLWRAMGNTPMLAANHSYLSQMHLWAGELEQAVQQAEDGFRLAGSINNVEGQVTSQFMILPTYAEAGRFGEGLVLQETAIERSEPFGLVAIQTGGRAEVGWVYGQLGAVAHGLAVAQLADQVAAEKVPPLRGWPRVMIARLHLLRGDVNEARLALAGVETWQNLKQRFGYLLPYWVGAALAQGEFALASGEYAQAVALTQDVYAELSQWGVRLYRPELLLLQGRIWLAENRAAEAHQSLTAARAEALAFNSRRNLWRILSELASIEAAWGHLAVAQDLRVEAQAQLAFIVEHCPPALRESFLDLPEVTQLSRHASA